MLALLLAPAALAGPHTAMVGYAQPADADRLRAEAVARGATVRACYRRARFCVLDFAAPPPLDALGALPGVRYAEADRLVPAPWAAAWPDGRGTAACADQWELEAVGAFEAWEVADGARGPVVAVADGGFLQAHEELVGHITGQYDYGNGDPVAEVEWDVGVPAHGTFIAALVAGTGDNGVGRAGLAPGAGLNLLKIADSSGALYFSYAASALADVADGDLGIRAVNYSIASSASTSAFEDAVVALAEVDVVLVAAAGNCSAAHCADADNDRDPLYPASFGYDHVIAVAGSTRDGGYNPYSHYGASSVDLAAPGVDLCSAGVEATDDYYASAGTSYAAPLVAATVALLLEAHPDLTPLELARVLRASAAEHPDWAGKTRSEGVLDAAAALATAVPRLAEPPDLRIDGTAALDLQLSNPGAAGEAAVVLDLGGLAEVVGVSAGWTTQAVAPGEVVSLPDAGALVAPAALVVARSPLEAHAATTLRLSLAGRVEGASTATARLVVASEGADYLNAPYDEGVEDPTGFLAWPYALRVDAVAEPEDTGDGGASDGGGPDGGGADGGGADGGAADGGAADGGGAGGSALADGGAAGGTGEDEAGCSAAGGGAGLPALVLLGLAGRRRVRRP